MSFVTKYVPHGITVFMSGVFVDSLRFKFTDHPNTQTIFGKLNDWSGSIGLPGLFDHTGLFSQYVIGSIEGVAATLLLVGIHPRFRHLQAGGALAGVLVMAGAVSFHLFTPLGTDPNNDGGGLFVAACLNLAFGLTLLTVFRRRELGSLFSRIVGIFAPSAPASERTAARGLALA